MTFPRRGAGAIVPRTTPPTDQRRTTLARLIGAVGLMMLTAVLFWLLTDDAFRVSEERVAFHGLAQADEADVRALLSDIDRGPNVFRVRASQIVRELSTLTEVDAAQARVTLPGDVSVTIDERDPVFTWVYDNVAWLVDEEGTLFAPHEPPATGEAAEMSGADQGEGSAVDAELGDPARAALPVVDDGRTGVQPPIAGATRLSAIDLAVMRQLLALTPELLGARAEDLHLVVDERDGYVLESGKLPWRAIFGHYGPLVQTPEAIPRQVQCLQWLLASEERKLERIRLAPSDATCGTFTTFSEPADGDR